MRAATEEKQTRASPTITKLITHFEMSNLADGKSKSTISWYRDILKLFLRYLKENRHSDSIEEFNIENARNYVLYLRSRNKFVRYTNAQVQHSGLSPQTVRGHIRGLKAFSSWLLGIAKGSVVNIIDDFRNDFLPLPPGMVEYVDELRHLVVDLKKHETTVTAVKPYLKLHIRMKEMGVVDEQVGQWLDICQDIASTTVTNNQFVQSALELAEVTAVNGLNYQSLLNDYNEKLELSKKLDIEIEYKKKGIAGLKKQKEQSVAEHNTITKAVATAQDNFEKQKENLKSQLDEYIKQNQLSWDKVNTVVAIVNTGFGKTGLNQEEISEISKQLAETGSLTVTIKQLKEKRGELQTENNNLEQEKVHFEGSVKSLTNINQKISNSIYEKEHQNDYLDITIQENEAKLKELTQSTSRMETTIYEANLIAGVLVLPEGLDDGNFDKLVGLMVALRQKRLGVGPKQFRDAEGNIICQILRLGLADDLRPF